ncbi:dihem cytochrome c family protein [Geminocystis sp. NIES-3709]|uniref:dihem cytochrome c family protein n=1 Tax=Geminocystis sp. NIES-3709 TaxID=1617448 RepID=UPI0008FF94F3|nr:dihem cytochrome c family protein [Geminocystis sp. NIES-3709]
MIKKRWKMLILAFIVSCSVILGWGASYGFSSNSIVQNTKSVDKATGNFKIGEDFYLENCATCHIPVPPAVLPQETWQRILENPGNHYGVKVEGLTGFSQRLMWQYLQNYSRQLLKDEIEPKYMAQSRYFFALHPNVTLPSPITLNSCIECHTQAKDFNYRVNFDRN